MNTNSLILGFLIIIMVGLVWVLILLRDDDVD